MKIEDRYVVKTVGVAKIMGIGHTFDSSRVTIGAVRAVGENFIKISYLYVSSLRGWREEVGMFGKNFERDNQ